MDIEKSLHMHPTRLPATMPIRARAKVDPDTRLAWMEREGFHEPVSAHSPTAPPMEDPVDRYTATWLPHEPHKGRRPPSRGIANFRGAMVDGSGQELVLESTLERAAAAIGVAFHKQKRIRSQVGPVSYDDDDGKARHSTFDFTLDTGIRHDVAVAVKPGRKVQSSGIAATVAAIREQRPDFAGRIDIWTEAELPRFAEHNADLILRCRRNRRPDDIKAMKLLAGDLAGSVVLGEMVRHSGLEHARAFVALVNLIDDRFLVPAAHERIGYRVKVRRPV